MLNFKNREPKLSTQLTIVAVVSLFIMTLYECFKQFFIPNISVWGSHLITIIFTTLLAIVVFYFILKQFHQEYAIRLEEIAQRKASEAALKESEKMWRNLVNNAEVGVLQVATDGRFIMTNNKFARILGYEHSAEFSEIVENISQLYASPGDRTAIISQLESTGFINRIEVEFKNRDSKPIWVLLNSRAYKDSTGEWVYEGFIIDITERKLIEEEKDRLLNQLEESMSEIKILSGLLPICANCKKIRDDNGYWNNIEEYIQSRSDAQFSHGCCPDCIKKLYPEYASVNDGIFNGYQD